MGALGDTTDDPLHQLEVDFVAALGAPQIGWTWHSHQLRSAIKRTVSWATNWQTTPPVFADDGSLTHYGCLKYGIVPSPVTGNGALPWHTVSDYKSMHGFGLNDKYYRIGPGTVYFYLRTTFHHCIDDSNFNVKTAWDQSLISARQSRGTATAPPQGKVVKTNSRVHKTTVDFARVSKTVMSQVKMTGDARERGLPPFGLINNPGSSVCYANSVIQCLAYLVWLVGENALGENAAAMVRSTYQRYFDDIPRYYWGVPGELVRLLSLMSEPAPARIICEDVESLLKVVRTHSEQFDPSDQQCAAEFFECLMDHKNTKSLLVSLGVDFRRCSTHFRRCRVCEQQTQYTDSTSTVIWCVLPPRDNRTKKRKKKRAEGTITIQDCLDYRNPGGVHWAHCLCQDQDPEQNNCDEWVEPDDTKDSAPELLAVGLRRNIWSQTSDSAAASSRQLTKQTTKVDWSTLTKHGGLYEVCALIKHVGII